MEIIPVINFEALNNPSLFSRVISSFELGKLSHARTLWKWGAFLVALVYAFNYVANRLKFFFRYYHNKSKSFLASTEPLLSTTFDDELYSSDDEDDVVSISSVEDDDNEEEVEELTNYSSSSYNDLGKFGDFSVKGQNRKFRVQRRRKSVGDDFSLCDLMSGNGVVQLWEGVGIGVERSLSFLELNKGEMKRIGSFFGSPSVVLTGDTGLLGLNVWDLRCSRTEPAVHKVWRSDREGEVVGVDVNRTGRVYVRDDVTRGVAVGDVRMVESPLAEYEEDKWWDADE